MSIENEHCFLYFKNKCLTPSVSEEILFSRQEMSMGVELDVVMRTSCR